MSQKKNVVSLERPISSRPWEVEPFMRVPLVLGVLGINAAYRGVYQALCYRWWRTREMACQGITVASYRDLAREAGVSVKIARSALDELEKMGWVKKVVDSTRTTVWFAQNLPAEALSKARALSRNFDYAVQLQPDEIEDLWEKVGGKLE